MKFAIGFLIGLSLTLFVLSNQKYKKGYEDGYQAGLNYTPETMPRIQKLHNITNMDSAIAKSKQMPSDSLNIILFNMYATKEERALVKSFALWIKKLSEVKE